MCNLSGNTWLLVPVMSHFEVSQSHVSTTVVFAFRSILYSSVWQMRLCTDRWLSCNVLIIAQLLCSDAIFHRGQHIVNSSVLWVTLWFPPTVDLSLTDTYCPVTDVTLSMFMLSDIRVYFFFLHNIMQKKLIGVICNYSMSSEVYSASVLMAFWTHHVHNLFFISYELKYQY